MKFSGSGLRSRLNDTAIRFRYRLNNFVVPPGAIINLVTGNEDPLWFEKSGELGAKCLRNALSEIQVKLDDIRCILDFGCGCGRVMRYLNAPKGTELHGCDYNPALAEWCRKRVPKANIAINNLAPPLPYNSDKFDLIYAFSTFTHWTVDLQKQWILEFRRVLKPNGLLLFTTHGDHYIGTLTDEQRASFNRNQPVVIVPASSGTNHCGAYHPFAFVKDELLNGHLRLEKFLPHGALGNPNQDVYLVRKPERAGHVS